MKSPKTLLAVAALCIVAAFGASCGSSPSSNSQTHQPPPPVVIPPTGTNYTTCTDLNGNNQAVPNWQSSLFINNYQPAIKALVSHYQGNASVQYIRVGLGRGGEINLPTGWNDSSSGACYGGFTTNWKYTVGGDSSFTWNAYLQSMVQFEAPLSSSAQPLLVSITPVNGTSANVVPDFIAPLAVSNGLSYGNQGLQASDIAGIASLSCGADWCGLFASVHPQVAELQTLGQSCPTGTSCVNNLSALTGPLDPLLPVAIQGGANDIEIYTADWEIAYDPTNSLNPSVGAPYSAAIAAASVSAHMQVLFPDPNDSAVASYLIPNAVVTGAVIQVDWSDFDLGNGNYDFTITDAAIAPWVNGGKKVALVLQNTTYGAGSCGSGGSGLGSNGQTGTGNCAMPPYMWTLLK
jgi:hypothetical protein